MLDIAKYQPVFSLEEIIFSLEDYDIKKSFSISNEGIKDTIIKIITWLREKIRALIDFIFKRNTVAKLEKELENAKEEIEEYKQDLKIGKNDVQALLDKIKELREEQKIKIQKTKDEANDSFGMEKKLLLEKMEKMEKTYIDKIRHLELKLERVEKENEKGDFRYKFKCPRYVSVFLFDAYNGILHNYECHLFFKRGLESIEKNFDIIKNNKFDRYEGNQGIFSSEAVKDFDTLIIIEEKNNKRWYDYYSSNFNMMYNSSVKDIQKLIESYENFLKMKEDELKSFKVDDDISDEEKEKIENVKLSVKYITLLNQATRFYMAGLTAMLNVQNFTPRK